eukprot:GHRQ01018602.1.p1 GENE.GHRQ01018602.1~~GHRQ01018602.1.p1  ORF type:complete len:271 (+),score=82.06 GHRQ01018602.1:627-1439(+)
MYQLHSNVTKQSIVNKQYQRVHARVASAGPSRKLLGARRTCATVVNSAFGTRSTSACGAARPRVSSSSSSRSLKQQHAWSPLRPGPKPAGLHIAASVHVRGRRVIICAALAGVADSPTGTDSSSSSSSELLSQRVKGNEQLITGQLSNGLRYVLQPNRTPPQRFEAHLEVHAGSVDEREHEQGVAHLVEHVTFLGSKRRESLLGTGARANAYTDFHHTVFHVHAPLTNCITGTPMLPQVGASVFARVVLAAAGVVQGCRARRAVLAACVG